MNIEEEKRRLLNELRGWCQARSNNNQKLPTGLALKWLQAACDAQFRVHHVWRYGNKIHIDIRRRR